MNSSKSDLYIFVIGVICAILIALSLRIYYTHNNSIDHLPLLTSDSFAYFLDDSYQNSKLITISGGILQNEASLLPYNLQIVLWDSSQNRGYSRKVVMTDRHDIPERLITSDDYSNSGFEITFLKKQLPQGNYEIILAPTVNDITYCIHTSQFIEVDGWWLN